MINIVKLDETGYIMYFLMFETGKFHLDHGESTGISMKGYFDSSMKDCFLSNLESLSRDISSQLEGVKDKSLSMCDDKIRGCCKYCIKHKKNLDETLELILKIEKFFIHLKSSGKISESTTAQSEILLVTAKKLYDERREN